MAKMDGYLNPKVINYDDTSFPQKRDNIANQYLDMRSPTQTAPSHSQGQYYQNQDNIANQENENVQNSSAYLDMRSPTQTSHPHSQRQSNQNRSPNSEKNPKDSGYLYPLPSQHSRKQTPNSNHRRAPNQDGYLHPVSTELHHNPAFLQNGNNNNGSSKTSQSPGYLNTQPTQYELERQMSEFSGKTRFDSGVGDLELQGLSPLPRTSTAYDYAGSNHYEEVPTLRRLPEVPDANRPVDLDTTPSTEVLSDLDDNSTVFRPTVKRKYANPLYSRMLSAASSFFSEDKNIDPIKKMDTLERQIYCQCLLIVILLIVTLGVTALCIYLMIIQSDMSVTGGSELLIRIQKLEAANKNFYKSSALKANVSGLEYNLQQIYDNRQQIEYTYNNLTSQLNSITTDLTQQVLNVSKMQGPPGVGNLSACYYRTETASSVGSMISSTTQFHPQLADFDDNVVMSTFCLVEGGESEKLEIQKKSDNIIQFRCRCNGLVNGTPTRKCTILMLLCPRYSYYVNVP